jgi:hypothetical protein
LKRIEKEMEKNGKEMEQKRKEGNGLKRKEWIEKKGMD